jgi:hypothetical protein
MEVGEIMTKAKRPYEGTDAYNAGHADALKDLYDTLITMNQCVIMSKEDIMEYLKQKAYANNE